MRKIVYVLHTQIATDSDRALWDKLVAVANKLIYVDVEFYEIDNHLERTQLEQKFIANGWVKYVSDDDTIRPYQAIDIWEQNFE